MNTMKIKTLQKSLLIAQTVMLAFGSNQFAWGRGSEPAVTNTLEQAVGYAPFKIREKDSQGYVINLIRYNPALSGQLHLISVDEKRVEGLSIIEIEKLLSGPVGSHVNILLTNKEGNTETIDMVRIAAKDFHLPLQGGQALRSDMFEYRLGGNNFDVHADNVDIFARAIAYYSYNHLKDMAYLPQETRAHALVNLILLNDVLGNIPEAQKYYELLSGINADIKEKFHSHRVADQNAIFYSLGQTKALASLKLERFHTNSPTAIDTSNYKIVKRCFDFIEKKNKTAALKEISILLNLYSEDSVYFEDHKLHLDIFSSLVTLARAFSDKGWISESNNILTQLAPVAQRVCPGSCNNYFIPIELAINAELAKKKSATKWNDVKDICRFTSNGDAPQRKSDYSFSERLRRLAIAYCYAGEFKRAQILIDQAFLHQNDLVADSSLITRPVDGETGEKILLLLDAAIISAKQNNWDKVQELRSELDKLPSLITASYGPTVVELARLYEEANKSDDALAFLKQVNEATVYKYKDRGNEALLERLRSCIDFSIAELYFKINNLSEALKWCESAIAKCHNNKIRSYLVLAGKIAEQTGDKANAADYYYQAALGSDGHTMLYNLEHIPKKQFLEKAYELADSSAKEISPNVLASICKELAQMYQSTEREKATVLYKRYLENTSDDNSKKAQILQTMAGISGYKNDGSGGDSTENKSKSKQLLEEAALLAEKSNTVQARHLWIQLAQKELSDKNLEGCLKHARHALALYSTKDFEHGNTDGLVSSSWLISSMMRSKYEKEAIALQQESIKRVSEIAGPRSPQAACEVALLFFLYSNNKYQEALQTLDRLLTFDLYSIDIDPNFNQFNMSNCRIGPVCISPKEVMSQVRRTAESTTNKEFALSIENKVLAAQRKNLPQNSRLIADTLKSLAEVYKKNGQKTEALSALDESWKIYKMYFSDYDCCLMNGNTYPELLTWAGRQTDASNWQKSRNNSPFTRNSDPLPPKVVERKTPEEYLQDAIEQFESAKAKTPYSQQTTHYLSSVILRARVAKKPEEIYKYSLVQLDILEHGGLSKRQETLRCYEQIVEAAIDMNKLDEALKWLDKMEKVISVNPNLQEVLKLAELEEKGKNYEKTAKLLEQAEKLLSDRPEDMRHLYKLEQLWKKIDRKDKSEKIKNQRTKYEENVGIPGPGFMRAQIKAQMQAAASHHKRIVESAIKRIPDLIEKEDWQTLDNFSREIAPGWGSLTPDERQEMSLKLIDWGELLIKNRKFDTGYKVMSFAYMRPVKLPFSLALSTRMADVAELLIQLRQVGRADYYLDSARVFLKAYEGPSPLKKSIELRLERLQKIYMMLRKKEFVPGFTFPEVDPPKDYAIERYQFAAKTISNTGAATSSHSLSVLSQKSRDYDVAVLKEGKSFLQAKKCPSGATKLKESENGLELAPGDYSAKSLSLQQLKLTQKGTVRIFLSGTSIAKGPVFLAKSNSDINSREFHDFDGPIHKLEIWYDGEGVIKIDENSKISAIIYAPNARIELCKNAEFCGMLLGRDIAIGEDVSTGYDSRRDFIDP